MGACWWRSARTRNGRRMLGYDTFAYKLAALVLSGAICGCRRGGLRAPVRLCRRRPSLRSSTSIFPLLWVLLGGAATTLGPLVGTLLMTYVIDLAGELHLRLRCSWSALVLVLLVLFFPKGLLGALRKRCAAVAAVTPLLTTRGLSKQLRRRPGRATPSTSSSRRARSARSSGRTAPARPPSSG